MATGTAISARQDRRILLRGLVRSPLAIVVIMFLYYFLPLDLLSRHPVILDFLICLPILCVVTAFQLRAVLRSPAPMLRAIEALSITIPLFLCLFAATYYSFSHANPANFSQPGLTRTDALYFTVTVFATVGFGDITATSQGMRLLVTVQMILDLLVLGAVVKVFFGAAQSARAKPPAPPT